MMSAYAIVAFIKVEQNAQSFREFCKTAKVVKLKDGRKVFVSPKFIEEHRDEIDERTP